MDSERTTPYTTQELAAAVNLSDAHVRRLLIAGKLAGTKLGRDWLISAEEGRRFIQERRSRWEKY